MALADPDVEGSKLACAGLERMGVPSDTARYFAFVYPSQDLLERHDDEAEREKLEKHIFPQTNALHALLSFGGFCYFDSSGLPVCWLALMHEERKTYMYLDKQEKVPDHRQRWLHSHLFHTHRLRRTTISTLDSKGARSFAWLLPDEISGMMEEKNVEDGTCDGGFVYTTANAQGQTDADAVYFLPESPSEYLLLNLSPNYSLIITLSPNRYISGWSLVLGRINAKRTLTMTTVEIRQRAKILCEANTFPWTRNLLRWSRITPGWHGEARPGTRTWRSQI